MQSTTSPVGPHSQTDAAVPRLEVEAPPRRTARDSGLSATPRWATKLAWAASFAALLAAVASAFLDGPHNVAYDASVALAALNAVVVVWYTFLTRRAFDIPRQIAEDERRSSEEHDRLEREAAATALLVELHVLTGRLFSITRRPDSFGVTDFFVCPVLEATVAAPRSLPAAAMALAVRALIAVRDTLTSLRELDSLKDHRATLDARARQYDSWATGRPSSVSARAWLSKAERARAAIAATTERVSEMREACIQRASWAYTEMMSLARELQGAGGVMPSEPVGKAMQLGERPTLPADVFPREDGPLS
jgi:hypothetical protein